MPSLTPLQEALNSALEQHKKGLASALLLSLAPETRAVKRWRLALKFACSLGNAIAKSNLSAKLVAKHFAKAKIIKALEEIASDEEQKKEVQVAVVKLRNALNQAADRQAEDVDLMKDVPDKKAQKNKKRPRQA